MSEHVPRHLLEALLVDAAQLAAASELRAHLAVCERCSERMQNMEVARAAFAREHSASDFARKVMAARSTVAASPLPTLQRGDAEPAPATVRPNTLPRGDAEPAPTARRPNALRGDAEALAAASRPHALPRGDAWPVDARPRGAAAVLYALRRWLAWPAPAAEARRPNAPRGYGWAAGFGALALASVALWVLHDPAEPAIRYRGAALQAYVQGANGARELREGEVLSGGAQLAFTYTLTEPRHLLLFGIDDAGSITRYFPDGTLVRSSALPAGSKRQLPVGIELDARPGHERLIALFSKNPLDQDTARAALEAAWQQARTRGKATSEPLELALPAQQVSLWFDKR